ncbi:MAG: heavy-metal-associated domain-containing protein [Phycisphaerales bacterium]|nr:heavy-metal-associated domain-containing protein [Phycisphaerales bacterium]MCB9856934.1 heavy-metal-associated domain-containing protein [Phycisphaerales bacterium]MCB9861939.1 heavy-metal-associated domain-containing protein [Phycisphaerales bacterium]
MKQLRLDIDGMTCGHCVERVHDAIAAIDGVHECDVQLDNGAAIVTFDDSVEMGELIQAVSTAGYRMKGFSPMSLQRSPEDEAST